MDVAKQLLELGHLMNREVVVRRGEQEFAGVLAGIHVGYLHSSGRMVFLEIEGFLNAKVRLQDGDEVVLKDAREEQR